MFVYFLLLDSCLSKKSFSIKLFLTRDQSRQLANLQNPVGQRFQSLGKHYSTSPLEHVYIFTDLGFFYIQDFVPSLSFVIDSEPSPNAHCADVVTRSPTNQPYSSEQAVTTDIVCTRYYNLCVTETSKNVRNNTKREQEK